MSQPRDPCVTVVRVPRPRSWPKRERGARGIVVGAAGAFTASFRTDAHFCAYVSRVARRLSKGALDAGVEVYFDLLVFDIDCPAVHGKKNEHGAPVPAPESWRAELLAQVAELAREHPGLYLYMTCGGARLVYALPKPRVLRSQDDARAWSRDYALAVAYLERRFGIVADIACVDWQRLFRLPHATRTPGGSPEQWPSYGDPTQIGALRITVTAEDVAAAKRTKPSLFRARRPITRHSDRARVRRTASTGVAGDETSGATHGACLLYRLLDARGDVIRPHEGNAWIIRCPNEVAHSSGETGDTSTILYVPPPGKGIGWIHCMHGHCARFDDARAWLEFFTQHEIAASRRACITRVA